MANISLTGSVSHQSVTGVLGGIALGQDIYAVPVRSPTNKPLVPIRRYGKFVAPKIDVRMGRMLDVNVWMDSDDWVLVKSSNVAAIKYNRDHRILNVLFKSGVRYEYDMVPEQTAFLFFTAKSIGKFLHHKIKKHFTVRGPFSSNTRVIQQFRYSYGISNPE